MENQNKKTVVVLGGGFGGLNTAVLLARKTRSNARIVLVDRNNYSLYHPGLYEVATADEEFTSIADLKHSIALPFAQILPREVEFMQGEIELVDQREKSVTISGKKINYDYLVCAFGSVVDCFGNQGLEHYCIHLKSLKDALYLRNQVEFTIQQHRQDVNKKMIRFLIGGGGFSGVELAGEVLNLCRILSWKYKYPMEKIEILIVEGSNQLLPGLPEELSRKIYERLKELGIEIRLSNLITEVGPNQIKVSTGETINYDLLIWTGGVRSVKIPFAQAARVDAKDRLIVDQNLSVGDGIFAIGDNALILDVNKRPLPGNATQAIYQAEYVAGAIAAKLNGQTPEPFKPKNFPYIIPVSGKWAAMVMPPMKFYGIFGWLGHRYADFRYFRRFLPIFKAFRLAWFDMALYSRND